MVLSQDSTLLEQLNYEVIMVLKKMKLRAFTESPFLALDIRSDLMEVYDCVHEEDRLGLGFKSFFIPTYQL